MHRILTAAWFPAAFALLQTVRYFAFLAHGYWIESRPNPRFQGLAYIREDLSYPLFGEYGFCGGWASYMQGQFATFGIDSPAYLAALLLHEAANGATTCLDALATPRGHLIVAPFVFLCWLLPAVTLRRLTQRRFHRPWPALLPRTLAYLTLVLFPVGLLLALASIIYVIQAEYFHPFKLAGHAFWCLYPAVLAAERLSLWPFPPRNGVCSNGCATTHAENAP